MQNKPKISKASKASKTQSKIWGGMFDESAHPLLTEFNASLGFDKLLYAQDIQGSIAHAQMLCKQKIISKTDEQSIIKGLEQVKQEIQNGDFVFDLADEDIHMAIEKRLTAIIGDAGKKLHTARSRNDQVALDFRLFVLEHSRSLSLKVLDLIRVLLHHSKEHQDTIMPGLTHLQHAQPISLSFHLLAYVSMFKRDYERLTSLIERNNFCPLGCAALAGSTYDTDRDFLAKTLGFKAPTTNCLDTVSDRDFALDLLYSLSVFFMHSSRLCEELILWSSPNFGFCVMSDSFSTGSSIMPQKKNPDAAELIRGKTGRIYGNLMSLLTVMKSLPLAYNKDMQEDKEGVFDSVKTAHISLDVLSQMLKELRFVPEKMLKATQTGHLNATDLADYLVKKGLSFRDSHFISAKAVQLAISKGVDLSKLDLQSLKSVHPKIADDVLEAISLDVCKNSRKSFGGTSNNQTTNQINAFEAWLGSL